MIMKINVNEQPKIKRRKKHHIQCYLFHSKKYLRSHFFKTEINMFLKQNMSNLFRNRYIHTLNFTSEEKIMVVENTKTFKGV